MVPWGAAGAVKHLLHLYLDISPMSKDALIEQLSSAAGDKFTPAQARHAANKVY
jgi:hypothetical protein